MTDFSVTDAQGRSLDAVAEPPSDAELSTRAFVGRWLRGEDVGGSGSGGLGGAKGHPDRGMDGVAMTADLWRAVGLLPADAQASCHLSRLLEWRSMLWEATNREGEKQQRTVWYVWRGWAGVLDPYVVNKAAYGDRHLVGEWQRTVRRRYGYVDGFYLAVREAAKDIAERLGDGWLHV